MRSCDLKTSIFFFFLLIHHLNYLYYVQIISIHITVMKGIEFSPHFTQNGEILFCV